MTQKISIITPEHVELEFQLAGLGSRFIAIFVDGLIRFGVVLAALLISMFLLGGFHAVESKVGHISNITWALLGMAYFVFDTGYFMFFEVRYNGQTPGKMVAKIRVMLDSGHPVDFRAGLVRNLLRMIDQLPFLYGLGGAVAFFSQQHRRIGDYAAGTLVVKRGNVSAAVPVEPAAKEEVMEGNTSALPAACLPYISTLTSEDYRAVRYFLDRIGALDPSVTKPLAMQMAEPIEKKLHLSPDDVEDILAFLQAVCSEWERRKLR